MQMGARGRRGFTLIETVVTVGIVATLAAVVVPQVVKQFDAADPARLAEDLNNIRTGLETFSLNVRPHQPDDIEDLANPIRFTSSPLDSTFLGANYTITDSTAWLGPYISASVAVDAANDVGIISTGYGATIQNHFALFDEGGAGGGAEVTTANVANAEWVAIRITGLSGAAFNAVNELIDGATEDDATKRRQQGRLRCPDATPTDAEACPTAFYLAQAKRS
jgi:prepilin-type N-terminal cleavage/methylation domain-containing protein